MRYSVTAGGPEVHLQAVGGEGRTRLRDTSVIQFGDRRCRCPAAVGLHDAHVQIGRRLKSSCEEQLRLATFIFEVGWCEIFACTVYGSTEMDWRLPREIVVDVVAIRHPQVAIARLGAIVVSPLRRKKEIVLIPRQRGRDVEVGTVDVGAEGDGRLPRTRRDIDVRAVAVSDPDILIRHRVAGIDRTSGCEVKAQSILRYRWLLLGRSGVDERSETNRV